MIARAIAAAAFAIACASHAGAAPLSCKASDLKQPIPANPHGATSYPVLSAELGEEGTTILTFVIGTDGRTSAFTVIQSSGSLRLDDASKDAVQGWTYTPAQSGGAAVACLQRAQVKWVVPEEAKPAKKDK